MEWEKMTALQLGEKLRKKEIGCQELTRSFLDAIKERDAEINAYILVLEEQAMEQAQKVQDSIYRGESLSSLAGVPMGLKDNLCTRGIVTSCGSKMLHNFVPPYSATVVEKLESAGAVLLGKLNMDEFAMGGSTETSYYGPAANPWDHTRVAGGSSGGSAAAIAAGEAAYTLGSDTGGSIRQPCSFCGVSGIKPTYGAVSRYGLAAFASSLDQIGPIGRTIEDCAAVLSLLEGHDKRDPTSAQRPKMDFSTSFTGDIRGLKIGIPRNYFGDGLDEDVKRPILEAAKLLEGMGARLEEVDIPMAEYVVSVYYIIACAEASSNLSRYDGVKYGYRSKNGNNLSDVFYNSRSEGFGMEVKRRMLLGAFVLSSGHYEAYYKKASQVRRMIQQDFQRAFEKVDMVLSPNAPTTAFKLGDTVSDPLKMLLGNIYTVSVNLAGLPAVTIPCGFGEKGMPVGLQLIGRPFDEPTLVRAAHGFQLQTDYHLQRAPVGKGKR